MRIDLQVTLTGKRNAYPADMLCGWLAKRMPGNVIFTCPQTTGQRVFILIPWTLTNEFLGEYDVSDVYENKEFMANMIQQIVNFFAERDLIPAEGWQLTAIQKAP